MTPAGRKWLAIFADILQYELDHANDGELLSEACDRWIDRYPILARAAIIGLGGVLIAHLANCLPAEADVISRQFWRRVLEKF